MTGILLRYWLDDKEYAQRRREFVPRRGDEVRFRGKCYSITDVIWIEDEEIEQVRLVIVPSADNSNGN